MSGGKSTLKIITLKPDDPDYARIGAELSAEPLKTQWFEDAKSEFEPGVSYAMVLAEDSTGATVPAAWAGWNIVVDDGVEWLRCCNNYVRHGFRARQPELYELAYRHRHDLVVAASPRPAFTYLYRYPIPLHLADGWRYVTGPDKPTLSAPTPGGQVHEWWRLVRAAT